MKTKSSILALILVNLFPIFGVLFFEWNLSVILFLYWSENIVIGFYNILKMLKAQKPNRRGMTTTINGKTSIDLSKKGMIMFFIFHYGIFTIAHGIFLFNTFIKNFDVNLSSIIAIGFLFISHGISYLTNYIGTNEYKNISSEDLMIIPYKRILVMHLTVIFGSIFLVSINDQSIGPLIMLTLVKTITDFFSHNFEHNQIVIANNKTKSNVYFIKPSLICKILPNYEKVAREAFQKSVETGKWEEIKKEIDPKTAETIENYWLKNKQIKKQ